MQQLIAEYKRSLKKTRKRVSRVKLLLERKGLGEVQKYEIKERVSQLNYYIRNLKYSISWMQTGRRPGSIRGIENLSAYQMEKPLEHLDRMRKYHRYDSSSKPIEVSAEDEIRINSYLALLSKSEREAFRLIKGEGFTYSQTAELMGCSRETVATLVRRAGIKINAQNGEEMQLAML